MSACDRCLAHSELTVAMASVAVLAADARGCTPGALIGHAEGAGADRIRSVRESWADWSAAKVRASAAASGLDGRCRCDPTYPEALRILTDAPPVVWIRGDAALIDACPERALGIVGTRRPTLTGRDAARRIAAGVSRAGGLVISGMALGIDAAAHEGALSVGAPTVAILASGADTPTPSSNGRLYDRILDRGAILSELPPGTRPFRWSFPARNRLIAALSEATLVVEAPLRSGALITVTQATDLGRSIYAVPGSLAADTCEGSNRLLVDGAGAVTEAADLTGALGLAALPVAAPAEGEGPAAAIRAALERRPLTVSELERAVPGLGPGEVELGLLDLELGGWVGRRPDGRYGLTGARAA
jgi:DNA processing protein